MSTREPSPSRTIFSPQTTRNPQTTTITPPITPIIHVDVHELAFWSSFEHAAHFLDTQPLSAATVLEAFKLALAHTLRCLTRRHIVFDTNMQRYLDVFLRRCILPHPVWSRPAVATMDLQMLHALQYSIYAEVAAAYGDPRSRYVAAAYELGVDMRLGGFAPGFVPAAGGGLVEGAA